jgi:1-phosphatidylinositol-4-phosphate 5-kinase
MGYLLVTLSILCSRPDEGFSIWEIVNCNLAPFCIYFVFSLFRKGNIYCLLVTLAFRVSSILSQVPPQGLCMTAPVALPNELDAISHSARVDLSRDLSCNIEKEAATLASLANAQDPHASGTDPGFRVGEIRLPNGDVYSGILLGNTPEGSGRYLWSDGCIYEGEWRRGMRHGQGKTVWPSGVTYEGEYSGGYIYGEGTYTGTDNIIYKGRWKFNRKHGLGCQTYPNGDIFEGSWIQGEIEGHGKYTWADGNTYLGNMKNGKMSGKGTLTWKNGDSYEGNWLDGMMHGYGIYTWNESGYYVGTWTRGLKDGKGTFYPKGCRVPVSDELYINILRSRGVLPDIRRQNHGSRILHSSSVDMGNMKVAMTRQSSGALSKRNSSDQPPLKNVSLERRWSLEVAIEKFIGHESSESSAPESCENLDDPRLPILEREYMQGILISEVVLDGSFSDSSKKSKRRQKKVVRDTKKPGETIIKGHRSYDLMLSLQLGIRYATIHS